MHSKTDERYDYQQQATHLSCSITLKNVQKSSFPAPPGCSKPAFAFIFG